MWILVVMVVGVLIGFFFFPQKWGKKNLKVQTICTAVLIFAMGVALGSRPGFLNELRSLGLQSLVLAAIPILLSILLVYVLTRRFLEKKK